MQCQEVTYSVSIQGFIFIFFIPDSSSVYFWLNTTLYVHLLCIFLYLPLKLSSMLLIILKRAISVISLFYRSSGAASTFKCHLLSSYSGQHNVAKHPP